MLLDLTFAHGFSVEIPDEWPGSSSNMTFVPPVNGGGKNGVLVHVRPDAAQDSLAFFAFGEVGADFSAVIASPQPSRLFVLSYGAGYDFSTTNASDWEEIACIPVQDAKVVAEHNMVLFNDDMTIAAYGRGGLMWKSTRLCWDELQIARVEGNTLVGSGFDPTNSMKPRGEFTIDLRTGHVLESDFDYAYKQHLF